MHPCRCSRQRRSQLADEYSAHCTLTLVSHNAHGRRARCPYELTSRGTRTSLNRLLDGTERRRVAFRCTQSQKKHVSHATFTANTSALLPSPVDGTSLPPSNAPLSPPHAPPSVRPLPFSILHVLPFTGPKPVNVRHTTERPVARIRTD